MLVVEGTDLVGKTHLCKSIIKMLRVAGRPHVYSHLGLLPAEWDYYHDYAWRMIPNVVQDRFFLSEEIYGTVIRERSRIDHDHLRLLHAELVARGGFTVVVVGCEDFLDYQYARKSQPELFELSAIKEIDFRFSQLVRWEDDTSGNFPFADMVCPVWINDDGTPNFVDPAPVVEAYTRAMDAWTATRRR